MTEIVWRSDKGAAGTGGVTGLAETKLLDAKPMLLVSASKDLQNTWLQMEFFKPQSSIGGAGVPFQGSIEL